MIGIIGAMEAEVSILKERMTDIETVTKASMTFFKGLYRQTPVVIVRSGICKVNAAICTQILIDDFKADYIINTGIAGSLKPEINIGDLVISTDVLHHDVDAQVFGYAPGQIPQMNTLAFPADPKLAELAARLCRQVNPDIQVFTGRILSGDQFVSSKEVKKRISKEFQGYCTEMEGAAIAQTAYLNNVPFVIIRAISDKADDSASMDSTTFEAQAIHHTEMLMDALIASL